MRHTNYSIFGKILFRSIELSFGKRYDRSNYSTCFCLAYCSIYEPEIFLKGSFTEMYNDLVQDTGMLRAEMMFLVYRCRCPVR